VRVPGHRWAPSPCVLSLLGVAVWVGARGPSCHTLRRRVPGAAAQFFPKREIEEGAWIMDGEIDGVD
jgi:hypothetical protein